MNVIKTLMELLIPARKHKTPVEVLVRFKIVHAWHFKTQEQQENTLQIEMEDCMAKNPGFSFTGMETLLI